MKKGLFFIVLFYMFSAYSYNDRSIEDLIGICCNSGGLVFDVGANVGEKTDFYLKKGACVICIEPQPTCVEHLKKKYALANNVVIIGKGLGEKKGTLKMHICSQAPILSTCSERWVKDSRFSKKYKWDKTISIAITTLDELIGAFGVPNFCKIDVENYEYHVLKGLSCKIPLISFEFALEVFDDVTKCVSLLEDLGYKYFNIGIGNNTKFALHEWVSGKQVLEQIRLLGLNEPRLWGDIYAKYQMEIKIDNSVVSAKEVKYSKYSIGLFKMVSHLLPLHPILLEAGAYDGASIVSKLNVRPDATIFSFEPIPSLYQKAVATTAQYPSAHIYKLALSDKIGEANFYLSSSAELDKKAITDASSSLLEPKDHLVYVPYIKFDKVIKVQTTTIDAWAKEHTIDHIDFMWLDMQGYELNTLKASPNVFKKVKAVVTEVEFVEAYKGQYLYSDVKEWFESQGFELIAVDFDMNKPTWYGDALFVRKEILGNQNL